MISAKTMSEIEVKLNKPQASFLMMPHKFRAFVAGYGCVHPDTRIWTEHGLMRISEISSPTRVLSFDEKNHKLLFSLSGGSFPKGKANLYRVSTSQGEFLASGHHHVFSSDYRYVRVDSLREGQEVFSICKDHLLTTMESVQKSYLLDAPHLTEKCVYLMGRYADEARLYGQQFLSAKDNGQVFFQEQGDVQELSSMACSDVALHMDGLEEQKQEHNHHELFFGHKHSCHSLSLSPNQSFFSEDQILALPLEHTFVFHSGDSQSLLKKERHHKGLQHGIDADSSFILSKVLKVSVEEESAYYDMHVVNTNNYICENGLVHHNSGKSWTGCLALCQMALEHPGINTGYFAPTYPHIRDIFFPTIDEVAYSVGLTVQIRESNKEVHYYSGKKYRATTICRSMDKPHSIVGFKIGHAMIDEFDVLPYQKAETAWRKIIARLRYDDGNVKNGVDITTTPEGFKYTHKLFVEDLERRPELKKTYGLIQASTYDNAVNLPDDYISSLIEAYPTELIDAYLNGQFVNLTSGTVYNSYDRIRNQSAEKLLEGETVYIGMDFNVTNMSAAICVRRNCVFHAIDELKSIYDTPAMIKIIKDRYVKTGHNIVVYPDASGGSRKTVDASVSDIALLRQAGFYVKVNNSNPAVKDRILSANKAFQRCLMMVDSIRCPKIAESLERLSYDDNGEPDKKSGYDHMCDALTYLIAFEMPIRRPMLKTDVTFVR